MLDQLDASYKTIDAEQGSAQYSGADRDYRYFAAQILPFRCLKGITYRFTPLAESSGVVDSRLVSMMYQLSEEIQIFAPKTSDLPTDEQRAASSENKEHNLSQAVFDYMTQPYEGAVLFSEGYELQQHLMNSCYGELDKAASRIEKIDLSQPIVWDNKMFYGIGVFPDDLDRYKLIGEGERHLSLAMKHMGMHSIAFFRSYSINDYFKLQTELSRLFVNDAFQEGVLNVFNNSGFRSIEGVDQKKRSDLINSYKSTFIRYDEGATTMQLAYGHLSRAVQELNLTWDEVKDKPQNSSRVLDPAFFAGFRRGNDATFQNWARLTSGSAVPMHSRVTDRVVTVNLKNFYYNPPKDLKKLLPTQFDGEQPRFKPHSNKVYVWDASAMKNADAPSKYQEYRNFSYHQAKEWDLATYKLLFPELKSSSEIPDAIRTFTQARGGGAATLGLLSFVQ